MPLKPVLCCLLSFLPAVIIAQSLSFSTYTTKDGLAGNQVYSICQDKDGFIWFGTETGVSRFDGTSFSNYTLRDGLPDNTIIKVFPDSKGRVWMIPFNKSVCYFYKGRIYNSKNEPALKEIQIRNSIDNITETNDGTIVLFGFKEILELKPNGKIIKHDLKTEDQAIGKVFEYIAGPDVFFPIEADINILHNGKISYVRKVIEREVAFHSYSNDFYYWVPKQLNKIHVESQKRSLSYDLSFPYINNINAFNDSIVALNTIKGCYILNLATGQVIKHLIPDHSINFCFKDSEDNNWLSTVTGGVIKIDSEKFRVFNKQPDKLPLAVYCLYKDGNNILIGSDRKVLQLNPDMTLTPFQISETLFKPVTFITKHQGKYFVGGGPLVYSGTPQQGFTATNLYSSGKNIGFRKDGTPILSTSYGLLQMKSFPSSEHDIIFRGRITTVYTRNDTSWFGSMAGLYMHCNNSTPKWLGDLCPQLQDRIAYITSDSVGNIWVATAGMGIVAISDNKIVHQLSVENGLSSDVTHCVTPDPDGSLWIGTDKGLDHFTFTKNKTKIVNSHTSNGLFSGFVNAVLLSNDTVFVGTPEGLSFFNKKYVEPFPECKLVLLEINNSGEKLESLHIPEVYYGKNTLSFHYTAISLKSGGNITYHYRLNGFDSSWKKTTQQSLEFISLPPGDYCLELYAINKFDVKSNIIKLHWKVIPHFWQTTWFIVLMILAAILITLYLVNRKNRIQMNRQIQEQQTEQRFQELEQKALLAQMNPHFIFNCLHAVQEFMLDKDILSANRYLNNFARLIRQTLDHSLRSYITLSEETEYLYTYLNLEQLRFGNKFDFTIKVDKDLNSDHIFIPCMMLQPIVENAIRHGIQHRELPGGRVEVDFERTAKQLRCIIRDNGPGITKVQSLKTERHIEYQSRGMQITKDRIELLNKRLDVPIGFSIRDIIYEDTVCGTEIVLHLPLITRPNLDEK